MTPLPRITAAIVAASLLAACASTAQVYSPVVDPRVGDMGAYPAALAECQQLAEQVRQADTAAAGAIAGALLSLAIGAALGARGQGLAQIAGAGAITSGTVAAGYAGLTQQQIVQRCLTNRGYSVLG
jgi:hypothetical protein